MYKVICKRYDSGDYTIVQENEFDTVEELNENLIAEIQGDFASEEVYSYEVYQKSDWKRINHRVSVPLEFKS